MNSSVGEIFGASAHEYDRHAKVQHAAATDLARIIAEVRGFTPGEKILDLGCGTGDLTFCISQYCSDQIFHGCDVSQGMLREACLKIPGIIPLAADFNQPDFLEGRKYDLIMSSFAFQWCRNLIGLFDYLSYSLSPSGTIAMALPVDGSLSELKDSFAEIGYSGFINDFPAESLCTSAFQRLFGSFYSEVRTYTMFYPSCRDILRSITRIGAAGRFSPEAVDDSQVRENDGTGNIRLTPGIVRNLSRAYEKYLSAESGYQISYRVLFTVAEAGRGCVKESVISARK